MMINKNMSLYKHKQASKHLVRMYFDPKNLLKRPNLSRYDWKTRESLNSLKFLAVALGERSFDSLSLLESLRIKQMSMVHLPCIDWLNNVKHLCVYLYYVVAMKLSTAFHSGFKSSLKLHIGCGCLPELSPNETIEQCYVQNLCSLPLYCLVYKIVGFL